MNEGERERPLEKEEHEAIVVPTNLSWPAIAPMAAVEKMVMAQGWAAIGGPSVVQQQSHFPF